MFVLISLALKSMIIINIITYEKKNKIWLLLNTRSVLFNSPWPSYASQYDDIGLDQHWLR